MVSSASPSTRWARRLAFKTVLCFSFYWIKVRMDSWKYLPLLAYQLPSCTHAYWSKFCKKWNQYALADALVAFLHPCLEHFWYALFHLFVCFLTRCSIQVESFCMKPSIPHTTNLDFLMDWGYRTLLFSFICLFFGFFYKVFHSGWKVLYEAFHSPDYYSWFSNGPFKQA